MGKIFKIRGNRDMRYVSQERVVKVVAVTITATNNYYSKWQPPARFLWYENIHHNCLKQCLIVMIY